MEKAVGKVMAARWLMKKQGQKKRWASKPERACTVPTPAVRNQTARLYHHFGFYELLAFKSYKPKSMSRAQAHESHP